MVQRWQLLCLTSQIKVCKCERRIISNFMALLPVHFCVVCPQYRMRTKNNNRIKKNYCVNINVKLITCLRTQNPLSKYRGPNWTFVIICSRRPHNYKTAHFTSWKERKRLRNVHKWKMYVESVQHYCFSPSNMQICDVLVAVVVLLAWFSYNRSCRYYRHCRRKTSKRRKKLFRKYLFSSRSLRGCLKSPLNNLLARGSKSITRSLTQNPLSKYWNY